MKTIAMTLAALALASTAAAAAPAKHGYHYGHGKGYGHSYTHKHVSRVTPRERAAINHSAARLAYLKRQAWADGRVNFFERARINMAQRRHNALVAQARRW